MSYEDIQKKLNKALRRNLENQSQSAPKQTKQIQESSESTNEDEVAEENEVGLVEENPE